MTIAAYDHKIYYYVFDSLDNNLYVLHILYKYLVFLYAKL